MVCFLFLKGSYLIFTGTSLSSSVMLLMAMILCLGELWTGVDVTVEMMNSLDLLLRELFQQKIAR